MTQDGLIGSRLPRIELGRLLRGGGRYVGDITLPRMLHACFVRSPYPHATIGAIGTEAASGCPGVHGVFTGAELQACSAPFDGVAHHRKGHRSARQYLLAVDRAHWQGHPVAVVVAETRAEAEDAAELVTVDYQPLPGIMDGPAALALGNAIHAELGDNLAFEHEFTVGDPVAGFASAAVTVELDFIFERQTGLTLEPRGLIADYNSADGTLTVHHAHQSPFQMQDVFSR